ncbi:MAG: ATP-dependent helicase HrpB, partial [Flammeovirgaceae bacterium]
LIMSATLDGDRRSALLNAPTVRSEGRSFPVDLHYRQPDAALNLVANVVKVVRRSLREAAGDVLVFLPGIGEIKQAEELLAAEPICVQPLYGELPFQDQQKAILPHPQGMRKVVLATSIAETSLTIEGINTVVDAGYARVPRFDPRSGLTRLETVRVTRDAADQRAGRAGRLRAGVCYRLWAEANHQHLQPSRKPEILEADLASLVLELANWGVHDLEELTWITPPPKGAVAQAQQLLESLEALYRGKITQRGKQILKLPTHPRIAHMLLAAKASALAADVAALVEERDPLPKESGADLTLRVELLRKWRKGEKAYGEKNVLQRLDRLATVWRKLLNAEGDDAPVVDTEVGRVLMEAYPERIAQQIDRHGYRYKLANGRVARLPDNDLLHKEQWLCVAQLDAGQQEGKIFSAAPVHIDDLLGKSSPMEVVRWDDERGMVVGSREQRLGVLTIASKPLAKVADELRVGVFLEVLQQQGLRLLGWGDSEREWQSRVTSLAKWRPNESWPQVDDSHLIASAGEWLTPFLNGITKRTELQRLDLHAIVQTILPWELNQKLVELAPTQLKVPSGSLIKIQYDAHGGSPLIEVRLQEMFGLLETPAVNEGRTLVMLHLLSPGYKPVQVTQDLRSFWKNTYHEVRKELRMRYPKHHWPEDPWTAQAVRGVVKKKQS